MKLNASLSETELLELARSLIPLRVDLSDPEGPRRSLDLTALIDARLIAGEGLMLAVRAKLTWPDRTLLKQITIERVDVLVEPRLAPTPSGVGLVIELRCRALDLRWVPAFLDHRLVKLVNERLVAAQVRSVWDLSQTLSFTLSDLGARSNIRAVEFDVSQASIDIHGKAVEIDGPMTIHVDRKAIGDKTPSALPPASDTGDTHATA
jgi:hypothetical protein